MKNRIIVSSILTIALCLSMIAGSTFALFTSEDSVNVAVTSGKVSVTATATAPSVGSTLGTALGTANANGNEITLKNLVPGDFVDFNINVVNSSTVTVKYRTVVTITGDAALTSVLSVSFGGKTAADASSDWATLNVDEGNATVAVRISLPEDADNNCQGKTCTITYVVEAVQGNVVFPTKVESAEELKTTLAAAQPGDIIDATGVTLALTSADFLNIPGGVTIKGATLNSQYRGLNYVMYNGYSRSGNRF